MILFQDLAKGYYSTDMTSFQTVRTVIENTWVTVPYMDHL